MEEEYFTKQILTYMGNKRTFLDRILSQFTMIFNRQGSEGALFLFLGRKS